MKKGLTTTQVQAYFKRHRLIIAEHDGQLWASDAYLLIPFDDRSVIAALLAEYNLPLEPMVCEVGRVTRRKNDRVPDIASFIPDAKAVKALKPIKRERLAGQDVFGKQDSALTRVYSNTLELPVILNDAKASMTEAFTVGAEWYGGSDPVKAVARVRDGKAVGLLMPIRADHAALRKSVAA